MKILKYILLASLLSINSCTIEEDLRPVFPPDLNDIEGDIIAFKVNEKVRIAYNDISFGYSSSTASLKWYRRKLDEDGQRVFDEEIRIVIRDFSLAVNYYAINGIFEDEEKSYAYYANKQPIRAEAVFLTDSLNTGYIEFIRFDPDTSDDRRAAGYFQFDAVKYSTGEVVKITQGHFSVRIN